MKVAFKAKKLIKEMKQSLDMVNYPIILFKGCIDTIKKKNNIAFTFSNIVSNHKKKIWLELNSNPILDKPDHRHILSEIHSFINDICP